MATFKLPDEGKIHFLQEGNPKREGSAAAQRWSLVAEGMTVKEAADLGFARIETVTAVRRGWMTVTYHSQDESPDFVYDQEFIAANETNLNSHHFPEVDNPDAGDGEDSGEDSGEEDAQGAEAPEGELVGAT